MLATIESAEVGKAKADHLTAQARVRSADANLRRETDLAAKRISSRRELEIAQARAATERAGLQAAVEKLRAIGLQPADLKERHKRHSKKQRQNRQGGGQVPLRAPIDGTVINRPITLGQSVERATDAFVIADLRTLWVQLDVYEKDLGKVSRGQEVQIHTEALPGQILDGTVTNVAAVIDEATRTAKVRVEIDNRSGQLRIGQLVTARILGDGRIAGQAGSPVLAVPRRPFNAWKANRWSSSKTIKQATLKAARCALDGRGRFGRGCGRGQ